MHDREDRSVGADAKAERQQNRRRDRGLLDQGTDGKSNVVGDRVHQQPLDPQCDPVAQSIGDRSRP